jgi:hypothetical protein
MFQIPVATSTAKAAQPTVSIPLSSRCRSPYGGLASGRYYGPGNGLGDDVAWLVTGRNINALR